MNKTKLSIQPLDLKGCGEQSKLYASPLGEANLLPERARLDNSDACKSKKRFTQHKNGKHS